jgi:hypothetical protein
MFRDILRFYSEELLALRPNPKQEDHPLSRALDWLFSIGYSQLLFIFGGGSFIRELRMHRAVLTAETLQQWQYAICSKYIFILCILIYICLYTVLLWLFGINEDSEYKEQGLGGIIVRLFHDFARSLSMLMIGFSDPGNNIMDT